MRLSKSNAQKLSGLVWRERARKAGAGAAVVLLVVGGVIWFTSYRLGRADPTLEVHAVEATVSHKEGGRLARYVFHAKLSDGREVDAVAPNGLPPPVGARVLLGEATHKSGRLTYDLIRVAE